MRKAFRLVLLCVVVALAVLAAAPQPVLAVLHCESFQGGLCHDGRPPLSCVWAQGWAGTCSCPAGTWTCL